MVLGRNQIDRAPEAEYGWGKRQIDLNLRLNMGELKDQMGEFRTRMGG
jgi:hypothetical protein